MDFFYSIVAFFSTGGVFMYPILIVFAIGVAIAAERYITLTMVTKNNQNVWDQVQPLLTEGDFEKAREMTAKDESTLTIETSKGQVVIPEEIRTKLGLKAGAQFVVIGERDVVILKTLSPPVMSDFDDLVSKARKQARKAGLKRSKVKKVVAEERRRR